MAMRDEDFGTALTLTEGDEAIWSPPMSAPTSEPRDWQSLCEQERARAEAAEARAEELRWAEVAARSDGSAWKSRFKACRQRLSEAEQETGDLRRAAKDVPSLQAEVAHLQELLSEARSGSSEFCTIEALRDEVARLHKALASKGRKDATGPLSRENARLRKALERSQGQKDEVVALRGEVSALRKSERAAQSVRSKESIRLGKALERTQKQKDTIKALRGEVDSLTRETRQQNRENGRLRRELEWLQRIKATARGLSDEVELLRAELAEYHDQMNFIDWQDRRITDLQIALDTSAFKTERLEAELAERPLLPAALKRLRKQEKTIESLQTRNERLEEELAKLRSSRAVLSKAVFGSRSERQKKPGTGRKRGQQRGTVGTIFDGLRRPQGSGQGRLDGLRRHDPEQSGERARRPTGRPARSPLPKRFTVFGTDQACVVDAPSSHRRCGRVRHGPKILPSGLVPHRRLIFRHCGIREVVRHGVRASLHIAAAQLLRDPRLHARMNAKTHGLPIGPGQARTVGETGERRSAVVLPGTGNITVPRPNALRPLNLAPATTQYERSPRSRSRRLCPRNADHHARSVADLVQLHGPRPLVAAPVNRYLSQIVHRT